MEKVQVVWKFAKAFLDEDSGVCVEISKAQSHRSATKYSVRIGRLVWKDKNEKGPVQLPKEGEEHKITLLPFITAYKDFGSIAHVRLQKSFAEPLARLSHAAEEWIVTEMAASNEEHLEQRREKEMQQVNRGKPVTKVTGKTARKRERERARGSKSA